MSVYELQQLLTSALDDIDLVEYEEDSEEEIRRAVYEPIWPAE